MNPTQLPSTGPAPLPEAPKKKSSCLTWVLGCGCGCLLALIAGTVITFIFFRAAFNQVTKEIEDGYTRQAESAKSGELNTFVNSRQGLDGLLAQRYVDFSFSYPKSWTLDPSGGKKGSANYAVVYSATDDYTRESFIVGSYHADFEDKELLSKLIKDDIALSNKNNPVMKVLGEGPLKFGTHEGYEVRTVCTVPGGDGKKVTMWRRIVAVKHPSKELAGVLVFLMGTDRDPNIKGIDDVGVKGELPGIIDSFEFK